MQEHPQVPVAHRVAEEQEVAVEELLQQGGRDQIVGRRPRQVIDVVILGDHIGVVRGTAEIEATVDLEHDRSPD